MASKVVTSSEEDKSLVSRLHRINRKKIAVVPNPIDESLSQGDWESWEDVRSSLELPRSIPLVVFVGNLSSPHNEEAVDYIAQDLAKDIRLQAMKARFLIVGAADKKKPEWLASGLMFSGSVKNIAPYIRAATVCIAPLISQPTGVKTKVLAYLACGKPTIATHLAATGIHPDLRKYITECDLRDFPTVLISYLRSDYQGDESNEVVSRKAFRVYGSDSIAREYETQVLRSLKVASP